MERLRIKKVLAKPTGALDANTLYIAPKPAHDSVTKHKAWRVKNTYNNSSYKLKLRKCWLTIQKGFEPANLQAIVSPGTYGGTLTEEYLVFGTGTEPGTSDEYTSTGNFGHIGIMADDPFPVSEVFMQTVNFNYTNTYWHLEYSDDTTDGDDGTWTNYTGLIPPHNDIGNISVYMPGSCSLEYDAWVSTADGNHLMEVISRSSLPDLLGETQTLYGHARYCETYADYELLKGASAVSAIYHINDPQTPLFTGGPVIIFNIKPSDDEFALQADTFTMSVDSSW